MMQIRFLIIILFLFSFGFANSNVFGASKLTDLKNKIEEKVKSIGQLEQEIKEYQKEIDKVGTEKKTLNNEIYRLNLDRKKLSTDLNLTDSKIKSVSLEIEDLSLDIKSKEEKIKNNNVALAETIRLIGESDSNSLLETILSDEDFSSFWTNLEDLQRFQVGVKEKTAELLNLKSDLEENKKLTEQKEEELRGYRSTLSDKKQVVELSKQEKDKLLAETKNKESNYAAILSEKQKLMEDFQKEIQSLESQLKIDVNPDSIPSTASGLLSWPLSNPLITQFFGKTAFATKNPQVYNGNGHPGVDFGASYGTPIKSSLSGVVKGTGNTDTVPPKCYSYGKWILVQHDNGLSTLYAHLSLIKVVTGQKVETGDIIGYSGNTGYSTGPHLHFSVYATKGVQIQKFSNSINCKDKEIPIASQSAYLNPMSYLPDYND